MTERIVLIAREHLLMRALVLAGLLSVLIGMTISRIALEGGSASGGPPAAGSQRASGSDLRSLAPAARESISASLGAEDPVYHFSSAPGGFSAVNRAQHLGIAAGESGVELSSRSLELSLRLRAVGYGGALHAVETAQPSSRANRVSYARAGISEWYVNGPFGLEQGFTLGHAPAGAGSGPLTLAIAVAGNARTSLAPDAQSVTFRSAHGASLKYGGLSVIDAGGHALHSWLALEGGQLLLRVDAHDARFPLRVDPTVEVGPQEVGPQEEGPQSQLPVPEEEGSQERAHAGVSVALSSDGNVALVGAPDGSSGAVWVFEHSAGGKWTEQAKLEMPQSEAEVASCPEEDSHDEEPDECRFGWTVALSADGMTALVGAPQVNHEATEEPPAQQPIDQAGAAWVFTHTPSGWQSTELSSPEAELNGHFGRSVALSSDGETALIGAPGEAGGHGRAWVFTGSGSDWSAQDTPLEGSGEKGAAHLGRSVALSGDGETALVGAPHDDEFTGAAWVFQHTEVGWTEIGPKLTGAGAGSGSRFGESVALSQDGSTALVGAPGDQEGTGAAWAFERSGPGWSEPGSMLSGPGESDENFGTSVALSAAGSTALVGAPRYPGKGGAAWIYERSGASWGGAVRQLESSVEGTVVAHFGESVAISADGETELVGAPFNRGRRGAAWVFGPGPSVSDVRLSNGKPARGPEAGGTEVEIVGEHLLGASAVRFGATEATEFKVESPRLIKAVSPPGKGSVDVTVETPIGLSELNTGDRFMYEPAGEGTGKGEEEEEPPPETGTGSSGGSPARSPYEKTDARRGGAVSVLAVGPLVGGACAAALLSKRISVSPHNIALLKLNGTGAGTCSGRLTLRVKVKLAGKRYALHTIGTAVFSIASGKRLSVAVKLNAAGRALLKAAHGRLNASLLIVASSPAPTLAHTANVRLARAPVVKPKTASKP